MRPIVLLALASALATGCGDPFDPRNELTRYEVLAVVADKPEPAPEDVVHLKVTDFVPEHETATYAWKVCLYSYGSAVGYACADPGLESDLDATGPEATLDLGPNGLNLRALYDQYGPVTGADGETHTLEDGIEIWVKLESGPKGEVQTAKRLVVRDGGTPNHNPKIVGLKVDGHDAPPDAPVAVKAGERVPVSLTTSPDSVESYTDASTGEAKDEELLYTWFTTDGHLHPGSTYGDDVDTELELPDEPGDLTLYVVVRDGRGGLAVAERRLTVR
jgi:hypothetical protein